MAEFALAQHYPCYCDAEWPAHVREQMETHSPEQQQTFYALHELLCFYDKKYALGETLILQTSEGDFRVTLKEIMGQGGSKKAILLDQGSVIMVPNIDSDSFIKAARWWPESVNHETTMAAYLEKIHVPALNRRKAYLVIPSKANRELSYRLPVFLSDSFEQYASKGWYIFDIKGPPQASFFCPQEFQKWDFNLSVWQDVIPPFLRDLATLATHNMNGLIGRDASNYALVKQEDGSFALRYFGFDFGGKYGSSTVSTKDTPVGETLPKDPDAICASTAYIARSIIQDFIFNRLYTKLERDGQTIDYMKIYNFSTRASEHFSSCDFIRKVFSKEEKLPSSGLHDEL